MNIISASTTYETHTDPSLVFKFVQTYTDMRHLSHTKTFLDRDISSFYSNRKSCFTKFWDILYSFLLSSEVKRILSNHLHWVFVPCNLQLEVHIQTASATLDTDTEKSELK